MWHDSSSHSAPEWGRQERGQQRAQVREQREGSRGRHKEERRKLGGRKRGSAWRQRTEEAEGRGAESLDDQRAHLARLGSGAEGSLDLESFERQLLEFGVAGERSPPAVRPAHGRSAGGTSSGGGYPE